MPNDLLITNARYLDAAAGEYRKGDIKVVNGTIACMFADAADRPITFPEDFTSALDPGVHGAFAVRGGTNDPASDPVYARPGLPSTFSGVAPQSGVTWPATLSSETNSAPGISAAVRRPSSCGMAHLVPGVQPSVGQRTCRARSCASTCSCARSGHARAAPAAPMRKPG